MERKHKIYTHEHKRIYSVSQKTSPTFLAALPDLSSRR